MDTKSSPAYSDSLQGFSLQDDLLNGAAEIADFLGRGKWNERKVRHAYKKKYLPLFSVGRLIKGRKSELNRALSGEHTPSAA
jgi:hypothetical protein